MYDSCGLKEIASEQKHAVDFLSTWVSFMCYMLVSLSGASMHIVNNTKHAT